MCFTQKRGLLRSGSATRGGSVPAVGYESWKSNLLHLHILKIGILTKDAVFWLILRSMPWSALKRHRGEGWPRQGEVTTTKRREGANRPEFSEPCRSMGWSPRASHALCVTFPKEIRCGNPTPWPGTAVVRAEKPLSGEEKATFNKENCCNYVAMIPASHPETSECSWLPVAGRETEARSFGPHWR